MEVWQAILSGQQEDDRVVSIPTAWMDLRAQKPGTNIKPCRVELCVVCVCVVSCRVADEAYGNAGGFVDDH
jgi:hypothetical protein